jgi:hypothetical protein
MILIAKRGSRYIVTFVCLIVDLTSNYYTFIIPLIMEFTPSPWICLFCGLIHCGRYVNGHGKSHFGDNDAHSVCLDLNSLAAFCYKCDEFVINDTLGQHLDRLRSQLQRLHGGGRGVQQVGSRIRQMSG